MQCIEILNCEPSGYCDNARTILRRLGNVTEHACDRGRLLAELHQFDVLIVRLRHQIDREVLDAGPRLRAVVTATTGLDHIDVDYAGEKGIEVLSLQGETDFLRAVSATSEHTWALLLALVRRLPQAFQCVQDGGWTRDRFRGHDLAGKRLGLIGFGRVAQHVAGYGRAFRMPVAAFDPYTTEWEAGVERVQKLNDLLAGSDIVSLHVPLNRETRHMIGLEELRQLPPHAVLVNTSRGEVIDETALAEALEHKVLAGAAVDVIAHERDSSLRQQSPLLQYLSVHDNLIVTPHIGGATYESMASTEVFMARKLAAFLKTRSLAFA